MHTSHYQATWQKLLSEKRVNDNATTLHEKSIDARNSFERDIGRIIYSYPFRRMQDKTQVIPFPPIDFVHSRLTHSLEVASVGRSFGLIIENDLMKKNFISQDMLGYIPAILNAAGLAHDIGNPPFGHAGERSISNALKNLLDKFPNLELTTQQKDDLLHFEGNAFGFKLLVNPHNNSNMNITCATLATFTKYPCRSNDSKKMEQKASLKKFGYFTSENSIFEQVFKEVGLLDSKATYCKRHPLAFLSEAADDLCYLIMDFEDGVRLNLIPFEQGFELLKIIAVNYKADKLDTITSNNEKIAYLRALSIGYLTEECAKVFINNHNEIVDGVFDDYLINHIQANNQILEAIDQIRRITFNNVYRSKDALLAEIYGNNILTYLIDFFGSAVLSEKSNNNDNEKFINLLPSENRPNTTDSDYEKLLKIACYIAGMTDSYAKKTYENFTASNTRR